MSVTASRSGDKIVIACSPIDGGKVTFHHLSDEEARELYDKLAAALGIPPVAE